MSSPALRDPASFRDPSGHVYRTPDGRIWRTVAAHRLDDVTRIEAHPVVKALVAEGKLIASHIATNPPPALADSHVIEHPALPFISYPYEWTFAQLREAALLHLQLHRRLLEADITLSDASAYNIQFIGHRATFIDRLSLVPYRSGELWQAHGQFISHFLTPLLLGHHGGIPPARLFAAWPGGISATLLQRIMPWHAKLSFRYLAHIGLPMRLEGTAKHEPSSSRSFISKPALLTMLEQLSHWIEGLRLAPSGHWERYYDDCHYAPPAQAQKQTHIARIIAKTRPARLIDLGGNDGRYAALALENGANFCITLDSDHTAATRAFALASAYPDRLLPLLADLCQPSPALGWNHAERSALLTRLHGDMLLALGLVHHLAIARHIPLGDIVALLLSLAPQGIIEWVDRNDAMASRMLAEREIPYDRESFLQLLAARVEVVEIIPIMPTRCLIHYRRL